MKQFFRVCSIGLVLTMLINMLPMSVFAEDFQASLTDTEATTENTAVEETTTEEITPEDAYVVSEITENRTEYSKEFLLSNGLHMATVYADAVHYETENGWAEIDNTLKANADGTYSNTAGVWEVSFPNQLSQSESVIIEKDGYILSFTMSGELTTGGAMVMSAGSGDMPLQAFNTTTVQPAMGKIQQVDTTAMIQSAEHPEIVPVKLQSQIAYAQVYENTDIVYDLDSNKVKESVILESYNAELQGYSYTLEVGTMVPVLGEDGSIIFYDETQKNIVMVMPAPYLIDDAGEHNYNVEVQLIGKGSTYTLIYLLPQQWLAAEDRAWPVVLDPVVEADLSTTNIRDRTVAQKKNYEQTWGMNTCGYDSDTGIMRFYLKYNALPALTSSDVVVGASIQMYKAYASSTVTAVYVHKVNNTWESESITWANKPGFNQTIEDYAIVDAVGWYGWEITDVVRDWYDNKNTGMMFKASDAIETGGTANFKQFLSSDFGTENSRPVLSIYFRNNNGLESYWDYTASSAGRAGTGYINNYTGNLTFIRSDIGFDGNRMPVTISQVYNLNDAVVVSDDTNSNDTAGNKFGMGYGWRTNLNQLVYQWNVNSNYYVWEDSDGTDHYFKHESGSTYKDEDGLELTLTTNGSGTEKYCITDKNGNKSYFDTQGRLSQQINNQATKSSITVTYTSNTSRQISTVTDGVGRRYDFTYSGSLLTRISYKGSGSAELSYVAFGYSGSKLTTVTDKDNKVSTYTYSGNLLKTATDIDGYTITYAFTSPVEDWQPYRVQGVAESDGSALGGSLTFSYAHNQTTITDYNGNTETYQFNDFGNTVSIQDDEGHAAFAQFSRTDKDDTSGKANQLKVASKLQNTVGNRMKDGSFENGTVWNYWGSVSQQIVTTEAYSGSHSLLYTANEWSCLMSNTFPIEPGETYTFSAYVKGVSGHIYLYLLDRITMAGASVLVTKGSTDWARYEVTLTNTTTATMSAAAQIFGTAGAQAYIDCVQVEKAPTASRFNLLPNGDFAYSGSPAAYWDGNGISSSDGICNIGTSAAPGLDGNVYKIVGKPTGYKQLLSGFAYSGNVGDAFVVSGWAKGNAVPVKENDSNPREFSITVALGYTDGTVKKEVVYFNPDVNGWQYAATGVVAEKAYSSIMVVLRYNFNANTVYFDGIQLYKEEFGNSYTYDSKGNVISVRDLQAQTTDYQYDTNSNLTKIIQNGSAKMTYTYDNYHNVISATTDEGLKYECQYDDYGNNIEVSITSNGMTMRSEACYIDPNDDSSLPDGNYLVYTKDALGKVTTYGYNPQTGALDWVQYPEDTAATRTEYTYDDMYRMAEAACSTDTGLDLSAQYTYDNDLLKSIQTPTTTYNFEYGVFGLRTAVRIGNRTLATYHYTEEDVDDRKYDLDRLDYGNGDKVEYEYDDKGRTTKQTYEDGHTVTYTYDNSGNLATVTDSASGITTTYYYDLTDRLMRYEEIGTNRSHSVAYEYDTRNNLVKLVENTNGTEQITTYTYDDDNRVETSTTDGVTVTYHYDDFGRVLSQETANGSTNILTESYTYKAPTSNTTSGQVATYTTTANSGYAVTYHYTYDDNGNILSISDGTYTTTYVYDSANQLIRENNQAGNFTYTWTYDNAGNILNRKKYAYTTGTLGTPTDTVTYTYGDSEWGDLLTAYDGNTITYDTIGNPLTDGTWTYTWQHGRQLASMTSGTTTWSYTYNADGIRTQRTNGTTTYSYVYNGSLLSRMTVGNNTLNFTYDANGTPLTVTYNGTLYYYITNLQGDVIAIADQTGAVVVTYTYDAWGNVLSVTGTLANSLGLYNPLRYRGYVYDNETGLYYLQSRYYNPETGRFLSVDNRISDVGGDVLGYNMFAYCMNNPVNMSDHAGGWPSWATKLVAAVAVVAVVAVVAAVTVATAGAGTAIAAVAVGAAKGAAIGFAVGAATGAASGAISHRISTGSWDGAGEAALNGMANGALSGAVSGAITGGITGGISYNSGATSAGKGFDTYRQLKNEIGSPGAGNEWHHIVEQSQIAKSGFSPQMIQNTNNIMSISKTTHRAISGYYSSVQPFTNGMIVRNWLAGQSFSAQYEFGTNVIKMFM